MSMNEALKARLVGAAVLVGVAMIVLGSLLGGPKQREAPADGVIVIRPEPERPPSLRARQDGSETRETAAATSGQPQPVPQSSRADADPGASGPTQSGGASKGDGATPTQRARPETSPDRGAGSAPTAAAPASNPAPAEPVASAPPKREPAPAPDRPAATQPAPADNDLYARIAGTAVPQSRPSEPPAAAQKAETPPAAARPAPRPATKPTSPPPPKPRVASNGWMLRVASFGDADNAQRMVQRLRDAGYAPSTETVTVANRRYTRVQVGPYASEAQARAAQRRLKAQVGESGQVIAPR